VPDFSTGVDNDKIRREDSTGLIYFLGIAIDYSIFWLLAKTMEGKETRNNHSCSILGPLDISIHSVFHYLADEPKLLRHKCLLPTHNREKSVAKINQVSWPQLPYNRRFVSQTLPQ
jgi:hypothetical protein